MSFPDTLMHFDVFHVLEPRTGVQGPVQVTQTLQALESGTMACDAARILNLLGLWHAPHRSGMTQEMYAEKCKQFQLQIQFNSRTSCLKSHFWIVQ